MEMKTQKMFSIFKMSTISVPLFFMPNPCVRMIFSGPNLPLFSAVQCSLPCHFLLTHQEMEHLLWASHGINSMLLHKKKAANQHTHDQNQTDWYQKQSSH